MSIPDLNKLRAAFPTADFSSFRVVETREEEVSLRNGVVQPIRRSHDLGAMAYVVRGAGAGYAATPDTSEAGLRAAAGDAAAWADGTAAQSVFDMSSVAMPAPRGSYASPVEDPWEATSLTSKLDILKRTAAAFEGEDRIVDWEASLWWTEQRTSYVTSDGGEVEQTMSWIVPNLVIRVHGEGLTQQRSLGGRGFCQQGGLEVLGRVGFEGAGVQIREEALQLLGAQNCPEGDMDIVLAPDQMLLQIHESIGHPLELDRILGDERNYAGTSFVTRDMFGTYQYGSDLLNITFDPEVRGQFASFGFDDEGAKADRTYIIKNGILERPLGATLSQHRAGMKGVANSRSQNWNRAPIDRMANLNLEPGDSSLSDLIGSVERGIYMQTNCSWSIDDSRNKFQFGCEYGRMIENGELGAVVRNPNYRGISATFWRNLAGVGAPDTLEIMGTPFCGKGEPNQIIRVGHASPPCLFRGVSVFGGA